MAMEDSQRKIEKILLCIQSIKTQVFISSNLELRRTMHPKTHRMKATLMNNRPQRIMKNINIILTLMARVLFKR
jgi:hypothetical protein